MTSDVDRRNLDMLKRKVELMFPARHDPRSDLPSAASMLKIANQVIDPTAFRSLDVEKTVKARRERLRRIRNQARAKLYVVEFPVFQHNERKQLTGFMKRMSWPKVNDVEKLVHEVRSLRSEQPNVPSRLRKFNPNLQIELRRVVFVAKRDIKPLEQLMFDYGDENARRIF